MGGSHLATAALAAVLAAGVTVVLDGRSSEADAQSGFKVSAEQLRINQRISQAGVRRSNAARTKNVEQDARLSALEGSGTGAQGPAGPAGPAGAAGPQGVPGPTASARASRSAQTPLGLNTTVRVVSLDQPSQTTGPIQMPFDGRLMAAATVELLDTGAGGGEVQCRLWNQRVGSAVVSNLGPYTTEITVPPGGSVTTTLIGDLQRSADSYDVYIGCFTSDPSMDFRRGHIMAWATA